MRHTKSLWPSTGRLKSWASSERIRKLFFLCFGVVPFVCPLLYFDLQAGTNLFKLMFVAPFACLAVGGFFLILFQRKQRLPLRPLDLLTGSFVLWMALSLSWSLNFYEGIRSLSPWLFAWLLSLVAGRFLVEDTEDFVLRVIFWAGFGVALVGIIQHLIGNKVFMVAAPPGATFGNRNMAGQFILLCFPFAFWQLLQASPGRRLAGALGVWAMLTFMILIRGRAVYLGLILELPLIGLMLWRMRERLPRNYRAVLLAVGLFSLGAVVVSRPVLRHEVGMEMMSFSKKFKQPLAGNERLPTWKNTWQMVREHPVQGVGVGQWRVWFPLYNDLLAKDRLYNHVFALTRLHNDFLEFWASLGTVGLLLLLSCGFYVLWLAFRRQRAGDWRALPPAAALVGIAVPACTSFPLQNICPLLFILLFAQLIARKTSPVASVSPSLLALAGGVLWVACPFVAWPHYRMVKSNALYFKGDYVRQRHPQRHRAVAKRYAYQLYKESYDYDPTDNIVIMRNVAFATEAGEIPRAIRVGREALNLFPYDKIIQMTLFNAYFSQKNLAGMKEVAKMLLAHSPRYGFSHLSMGHFLWFSGRQSEALDSYARALELDRSGKMRFPEEAKKLLRSRGVSLSGD